MNAIESAARSNRRRSAADIEIELQHACRTLGALAGAARMGCTPIDRRALTATAEGLQRLLREERIVELEGTE